MAIRWNHAAPVVALALLAVQGLEARDRRPGPWGRGTPVDRALANLDRAARNARWIDNHERKHFERATRELLRFQERWYEGRFDRGRLNEGIENIEHLVQSRQLHPMDRRVLASDLAALRDFRARAAYTANRPRYPW